jgi:hypothetical protein
MGAIRAKRRNRRQPSGSRVSGDQRCLLRAFRELTAEQRLALNFLIAELMLRANPELLEARRKAALDPSAPFPKPSWTLRMRRARGRARVLEIHEEIHESAGITGFDSDGRDSDTRAR